MNAITTKHGQVCVGDKYHHPNGGRTVEITRISDALIFYAAFDHENRADYAVAIDCFLRMEAKAIEAGARFDPAPPAPDATAAGRTQ